MDPRLFNGKGIKKVIVLNEKIIKPYETESLYKNYLTGGVRDNTLSKYIHELVESGVKVHAYGIDQHWTDGQHGRSDTAIYPQSFNSINSDELIRKIS